VPDASTVIERVVAPVDHEYVLLSDAVSVTEPPSQNVVGPLAVIVDGGSGFTVTTVAKLCNEQPSASVVVTL
jgi:hypothetical protein